MNCPGVMNAQLKTTTRTYKLSFKDINSFKKLVLQLVKYVYCVLSLFTNWYYFITW